jgi:hypothetical protein
VRDDPARRLADELRRHGLDPVARLLVDAHRPLAPLLADAGAAVGPLLSVVGGWRVADLRRLVEDADGLERLARELDDDPDRGAEERHAEPG